MSDFVFLGFNIHAWITIVTVLAMFSMLLFTKVRTDLVFLAAIGVLFVTGVLDRRTAGLWHYFCLRDKSNRGDVCGMSGGCFYYGVYL